MNWYLVLTKSRQERTALLNLERQGYECYLPLLHREKLKSHDLTISEEPLFPRYLFIRLDDSGSARSWSPIRSTRGVSKLVSFGQTPTKVDDQLISALRQRQSSLSQHPARLFSAGDTVRLSEGAFAGIEGVYQMPDGERRAMVLIEILGKAVRVRVAPGGLRKITPHQA